MRGAAESMTVLRPGSVDEAVAVFGRIPTALPFAGGTDLMVAWNLGALNGRVMLDLSRLREWTRIRRTRTGVWVGALATHTAIQHDSVIRRHFQLLVAACATIGGVQIQNRGTIGGNIANASPAADTFPALAVYDACVHLASAAGRRTLPFIETFSGPKKTTLAAGELIEAVELPIPARRPDRELFRKVGTRAAQAIAKTVAAGLLWVGEDGIVEDVRLALGSMAPTVKRLRQAEAYLRGRSLTPQVAREAAGLVGRDVAPIGDIRSTAEYRLAVSQRIVEGFLIGSAGGRSA